MLPKISRFRVNGAFHLLTGIVIGSIFTHVCHVNLVYEPPVTAFPQVSGIGRRKQDAEDVARFDEKCRLALYTKDDDTIATRLQQEVRLLCWVMTSPENLYSKAIHVKDTWGKRCDHLLFASDSYDPSFPTINITVQSGTEHLVDKTIAAFDYIYKYYLHKADWFLKADDDTYIVVENLRYLLSRHDPQEPVFFGNHFMTGSRIGFMSGGAGYVTSKKALQRFGERSGRTCHDKDAYAEDILWAQCMEQLGVHPGDSRDVLNRSRFHCQDVNSIIHGSYPDWIPKYQKYGAHKGAENMSEFAVSFHYIKPEMMHTMDYLIYKLKPYGIVSGLKKT